MNKLLFAHPMATCNLGSNGTAVSVEMFVNVNDANTITPTPTPDDRPPEPLVVVS